MKVNVTIVVQPEHPHLRPLSIVLQVPNEEQARTFGFDAGQEGFWYAKGGVQPYRLMYIPPCRIVHISYQTDYVSRGLISHSVREIEWGEVN